MRRSVLATLFATAFSFVACSDQPTEVTAPPNALAGPSANLVAGCPTTPTAAQLLDLVNQLVPPGTIRNNITKQVNKLPTKKEDRLKTAIREQIFPIQDAILRAFYAGLFVGGTSATTFDKVLDLIEALYCYVGLTPPEFPASSAGTDIVVGVVFPTSPTTTFAVPSEQAAVTIPTGAAPSPTTIVITKLPDSPGPLRTTLDQYPFFYHFSGTTATGPVTFNLDVIAGICLKDDFDVSDANLRLAHNVAPFGFGDVEVLPRPTGTPPGIDCTDLPAGPGPIGFLGDWGRRSVAWAERLLLPSELHASSTALVTAGVGGTTKKFSEFGIVDIFSNPASLEFNPDEEAFSELSAEPGAQVSPAPSVRVTSSNGTPIANVPVEFAVGEGGGSVNGGSEATVDTDENGIATVDSWILGEESGTYSLSATPRHVDQDPATEEGLPSPPYHPAAEFNFASLTFTATTPEGGTDPGSPTSTTLSSQHNNPLAVVGEAVEFTATVSPTPTGGQVEFFDGTISLGVASLLLNGRASITVPSFALAAHPITAKFLGTTGFAPSTSNVLTVHTVQRYNTLPSFAAALAGAATEDQTFEELSVGTAVLGIVEGVVSGDSPFPRFEVASCGGSNALLGFGTADNDPRSQPTELGFINSFYQFWFEWQSAPRNAFAFEIHGKSPTSTASVLEIFGVESLDFATTVARMDVTNTDSEDTPVFVGMIASLPLNRVIVNEGLQTNGEADATCLDNFRVASVSPLQPPVILLRALK